MKIQFPSIFTFEDEEVNVVYIKGDSAPYYNATAVAKALKLKSPATAAISSINSLCERLKVYCEIGGHTLVEHKPVEIANSVKPAEVLASDGVISVLRIAHSRKITNTRFSYYYNQEGLYEVLLNSQAESAQKFRLWITHEVLPAIAKYGEYIAARKDGIGLRRLLTDSIKRGIDENRLTDKAYADITDAVYFIRYGLHTETMRILLRLPSEANIREALPQDELRILGEIENKISGCVDMGMSIEEIAQNKRFIKLYRKTLV